MDAASEQQEISFPIVAPESGTNSLSLSLFLVASLVALTYAFLAGLRTVTDFDLGWQLATGRWIVHHHQIPSTEVFSYTAQGQPWIYPVGSGLLFYATYLLGNYALLSWLGAAACATTVAILLRRGSIASAALALLAVPLIAARTTPRADMFTVVLFAAFLSFLWQQHETGRAALWCLPVLMIAWVNLHLGFAAGLALLGGYVLLEALEMVWPGERRYLAAGRLRRFWPWTVATIGAMLVNPWGWGILRALSRQQSAMAAHSQSIIEWSSARLNWTTISAGLSLRNPDAFSLLLLVTAVAVLVALLRRQFGAAVLLSSAALLALRHVRFQALFAVVSVIVGGAVLTHALRALRARIAGARLCAIVALAATLSIALLASVRCFDLVTDRAYLGTTDLGSFGAGLSWWFPEDAAAFIERENIPGNIFNEYNEGGYFAWRLGPKYPDYIDGRAIPFGQKLFERNNALVGTPPDSPEWQSEAEHYSINAVLIPLARYNALQFFPVLRQFCSSENWRPVYLDEVSAVFLRRTPETESLLRRLQIDCTTAPVPAVMPQGKGGKAFNQWANAAALLRALGRNSEAFAATTNALAIFQDTAFVHFLRGNLLEEAGNLPGAEQQYLSAAALEGNAATWSTLAALYHREGQLTQEIDAWEHAIDLLPNPALALLSLGYADLDTHRPEQALQAFDRAIAGLPAQPANASNPFLANVAHGRAMAWIVLGNLQRATSFEEETLRFAPERSDDWLYLANLYDRGGRTLDAQQARARAAALTGSLTLPR